MFFTGILLFFHISRDNGLTFWYDSKWTFQEARQEKTLDKNIFSVVQIDGGLLDIKKYQISKYEILVEDDGKWGIKDGMDITQNRYGFLC